MNQIVYVQEGTKITMKSRLTYNVSDYNINVSPSVGLHWMSGIRYLLQVPDEMSKCTTKLCLILALIIIMGTNGHSLSRMR